MKKFQNIPKNSEIYKNTGGKNTKNPEKYSEVGKIFQKFRKILLRPKKKRKQDPHFILVGKSGKMLRIKKNWRENLEKYLKFRKCHWKNDKTRKNTRNSEKFPRKLGKILVRPKKRSLLQFG